MANTSTERVFDYIIRHLEWGVKFRGMQVLQGTWWVQHSGEQGLTWHYVCSIMVML
jgi:hypothetical protein